MSRLIRCGGPTTLTEEYNWEANFELQDILQDGAATVRRILAPLMIWLATLNISSGNVHNAVNNIINLIYLQSKAESMQDWLISFNIMFKLVTGNCLSETVINMFLSGGSFGLQAGDISLSDITSALRFGLESYDNVQTCPLTQKLHNLYAYMGYYGFCNYFYEMPVRTPEEFQLAIHAKKVDMSKGVLYSIVDTLTHLLERVEVFQTTGNWSCFIHNSNTYSQWLSDTNELIVSGKTFTNLTIGSIDYLGLISKMQDSIRRGREIVKLNNDSIAQGLYNSRLLELMSLYNEFVMRSAACKTRMAPFGAFVFGDSSICKTQFVQILYVVFGKKFGMDVSPEYRFTRSPTDEYWTNFRTTCWCIQIDDAAQLNPNKCPSVDQSLIDIHNVINNVPYCPPQAALDDKGRTPVVASLVTCTSNVPDLHAKTYFSFPVAVMRRFGLHIYLEVKQEYRQAGSKFVDGSKIPPTDGGFMNIWNIKVLKLVVPENDVNRTAAKLRKTDMNADCAFSEDKTFTDIYQFIEYYLEKAALFREHQERAYSESEDAAKVDMCYTCFHLTKDCVCDYYEAPEVPVENLETQGFAWWSAGIFMFIARFGMPSSLIPCALYNLFVTISAALGVMMWDSIAWTFFFMLKFTFVANFCPVVCGFAMNLLFEDLRFWLLHALPYKCYKKIVALSVGTVIKCKNEIRYSIMAGCLAVSATILLAFRYRKTETDGAKPTPEMIEVQGGVLSPFEMGMAKDAKQNPYHDDNMGTVPLPLSSQSTSLKTFDSLSLRDFFSNNVVRVSVVAINKTMNARYTNSMCGVFIYPTVCFTNYHLFEFISDTFTVTILSSGRNGSVTHECSFTLQRSQIAFNVADDQCCFEVLNTPPRRNISSFLTDHENLSFYDGIELIRGVSGNLQINELPCLALSEQIIPRLDIRMKLLVGGGTERSVNGTCGSPLFLRVNRGVLLAGAHIIGGLATYDETYVGFATFKRKKVEDLALRIVEPLKIGLQGEGDIELTPFEFSTYIPEKSIFRYMEGVRARVYGSLSVPRAHHKSKVKRSMISDVVEEKWNTKCEFGKPVMVGWAPWRNNVLDMVLGNSTHDSVILKKCVNAYVNDIEASGILKSLITEKLSEFANVNGIDGVAYIDGINRQTSMGFPYYTSKTDFLFDLPDFQNKVDFGPDVWKRVAQIEAMYRGGYRAHPIFIGHLKDEPKESAKIDVKKTRMFSIGPCAWSLVVRKYLLHFVRHMEQNKYVYEAAPGMNAQSKEWEELYHYLTYFGTDQIVAGDYSKFDKKMTADFILSAIQIIIELLRKAGADEEHLLIVYCIGMDIAFPTTLVRGDLVEFNGSNPSGHPLTVVINCLVNSLYVRYTYFMLNEGDLSTFKLNVRLMTYGDDNIMGVSRNIPNFNHCTISEQLKSIGVGYTMADKLSESVPYIDISQASFLKRKWLLVSESDNPLLILAPLLEESIIKSMCVIIPSDSVSEVEQMGSILRTVVGAYFFHGEKKFAEMRDRVLEVIATSPSLTTYFEHVPLPGRDKILAQLE